MKMHVSALSKIAPAMRGSQPPDEADAVVMAFSRIVLEAMVSGSRSGAIAYQRPRPRGF